MGSDVRDVLARGFEAFSDGDFASAERLAATVLLENPGLVSAMVLRAISLAALRRPSDALPLLDELTRLQPMERAHWTNLANCLMELERWPEVLSAVKRADLLGDDSEPKRYAEARARLASGDLDGAWPIASRLFEGDPDSPDYILLKVRLLLRRDEIEQAGRCMAGWLERPMSPQQADDAGDALLDIGWYDDALACFERALGDPETFLSASLGRVCALERLNRIAEAEEALTVLEPHEGTLDGAQQKMWYDVKAQLASRAGRHDEAIVHWQKVIAAGSDELSDRADVELKLGRAHQACGRHDVAMMHANAGHALKLERVRRVHRNMAVGDRLLDVLDVQPPSGFLRHAASAGSAFPDPIFVVGFPRSGTTLLEQFLDAHDGLCSFDEQPFLHRRIEEATRWGQPFPEFLSVLTQERIDVLRDAYFKDVARLVGRSGSVRPVDKNPLNLVRLPLVAALFPKSKVLFALRHPCDVVLSCYFQNFRSPAFAVNFATLERTAAMYSRVMAHFERCRLDLALDLHVVRYESFVTEFGDEAPKVTSFLGLRWDERLASFTERAARRGSISTPSYSQVIQPLYQRAVGRWEAYRPWFDSGAMTHLAPWIKRWGYG